VIPTFILGLFGAAAPKWLSGPLKWLADALIVAALLGGVYAFIYHRGQAAGTAKVKAQAEVAHAKTVTEARSDERQAQVVVDAIGTRAAIADDKTTTLVRSRLTEIHDALDSTPGAVAGSATPPAVFDTGGVRASLNAVVADANRSADDADAEQ
jgi:hypothetical protein